MKQLFTNNHNDLAFYLHSDLPGVTQFGFIYRNRNLINSNMGKLIHHLGLLTSFTS